MIQEDVYSYPEHQTGSLHRDEIKQLHSIGLTRGLLRILGEIVQRRLLKPGNNIQKGHQEISFKCLVSLDL